MKPTTLGVLIKGIADIKDTEIVINDVVTDSRKVTDSALFVAIKGENHNGHDYINDAFQRGAAACIVSNSNNSIKGLQIVVEDTKEAHILIGKNYKEQFDVTVFAITGSVGKTTTKEMVALILDSVGSTVKNEGNLNNEIGLPQTMFEISNETEFTVLEMGMNELGDIRKLTLAAKPDAAIITTIGVAHIEYLKTRENILKAKLEIVEGMNEDGILAINGDDELLLAASRDLKLKTVSFAIDNTKADVLAQDIFAFSNSTEFTINDSRHGLLKTKLPAIGNHNIMNALSAYALTTRMGIAPETAVKALANYKPTGMRQNIVDYSGITIIEDCYNANPDSMKAALLALSSIPVMGIRIAVLGDMLELGELTALEHKNLVILAAACGIDVLLGYGQNMKKAMDAAIATRITDVRWFEHQKDMADYLIKTAKSGDAVLFKASRSIKLEGVLELFYKG